MSEFETMDFKHPPQFGSAEVTEQAYQRANGHSYDAKDLFPIMFEQKLVNQPQIKYLIDRLIAEDTTNVIWGLSKACKSFLLVDFALSLTHGVRWHGHETSGQCAVALIVAEGSRGIGKRVRGWKLRHKIDHAKSPFVVIPTSVNILQPEEVEKLIWQLQNIERDHGFKFGFIGIDTLAKCMVGGDENHARDMGIAVAHCDLIRERMGGCPVAVVHHCGKDLERGPRGSYALFGGVNTSMYIERTRNDTEDFMTVSLDKQKDDDDDVSIRLNLVKLTLPVRDGDNPFKPESTLILDTFTMDCPKATAQPADGCQIDPKYADLISITTQMPDSRHLSVTNVAKMVFGHERCIERVREAVPVDWTEVGTSFGIRYIRQFTKTTKTGTDRHYIECRHHQ